VVSVSDRSPAICPPARPQQLPAAGPYRFGTAHPACATVSPRSDVETRRRVPTQASRSRVEYTTRRPSLKKAGPPPKTRYFERVLALIPRYCAASGALSRRYSAECMLVAFPNRMKLGRRSGNSRGPGVSPWKEGTMQCVPESTAVRQLNASLPRTAPEWRGTSGITPAAMLLSGDLFARGSTHPQMTG